jgi:hypothetical protein
VAERRWTEWEAATLVWLAQERSNPPGLLSMLCREHRRWLASLRSRGISMHAVRRLALDDPRATRSELESRADAYLQRLTARTLKERH